MYMQPMMHDQLSTISTEEIFLQDFHNFWKISTDVFPVVKWLTKLHLPNVYICHLWAILWTKGCFNNINAANKVLTYRGQVVVNILHTYNTQ